MANSLEVRVPLLDHKVVEFAYSLPLSMKLRDGKGKYLLRKIMGSFLPPDFLAAPKMGFRIPFVPWMQGPLRTWAETIVFHDSQAASFLDPAGVRQLWGRFQGGQTHLGDLMGILLSCSLWSRTGSPSRHRDPGLRA
jgi:asparagine synthase (glutamine-hydrolysing)